MITLINKQGCEIFFVPKNDKGLIKILTEYPTGNSSGEITSEEKAQEKIKELLNKQAFKVKF